MDGVGGKRGWQWCVYILFHYLDNPTSKRIFILEGILTAVISVVAYFIVPTWSHKAKFVRRFLPSSLAKALNFCSYPKRKERSCWIDYRQTLMQELTKPSNGHPSEMLLAITWCGHMHSFSMDSLLCCTHSAFSWCV
jgi:hypothetical protein